jgi:hypothetical protein
MITVVAGHTQAAPTKESIEARLKGSFLMLRGTWAGEKLAFDSQGNLVGTAEKTFFSLSAVIAEQVELSDRQLEIRGRRAGLTFHYNGPRNMQSEYALGVKSIGASPYEKTYLDVTVERDPQHPEWLEAGLSKVFSIGIDDSLANSAPHYWRTFLQHSLHPSDIPTSKPQQHDAGIKNPILRYAQDSLLSRAVKLLHATGVSVIGLTVDISGMPQDVHILRPLGMGSDEYAVAEVLQYRFTPAMDHGRPVEAKDIQIEVNFRE